MQIFPAIDLRGRPRGAPDAGGLRTAVDRLRRQDPVPPPRSGLVQAQGATCLHAVDLDGAKDGSALRTSHAVVRQLSRAAAHVRGGGRRHARPRRGVAAAHLAQGAGPGDPGHRRAARISAWSQRVGRDSCGRAHRRGRGRDAAARWPRDGWREREPHLHGVAFCQAATRTRACATVIYTDIARDGALAGHQPVRCLTHAWRGRSPGLGVIGLRRRVSH